MKTITIIFLAAVMHAAGSVQAQDYSGTQKHGPTRTETIVVKPDGNGYEVRATLTYRFNANFGDVTLDGYISKRLALFYWFDGKRYSATDVGGFKTGKDLLPYVDFTADVHSPASKQRIASGKWHFNNPVELGWLGALGDFGTGGTGLKNHQKMINDIYLQNIRVTTTPYNVDSKIENLLKQRK